MPRCKFKKEGPLQGTNIVSQISKDQIIRADDETRIEEGRPVALRARLYEKQERAATSRV